MSQEAIQPRPQVQVFDNFYDGRGFFQHHSPKVSKHLAMIRADDFRLSKRFDLIPKVSKKKKGETEEAEGEEHQGKEGKMAPSSIQPGRTFEEAEAAKLRYKKGTKLVTHED